MIFILLLFSQMASAFDYCDVIDLRSNRVISFYPAPCDPKGDSLAKATIPLSRVVNKQRFLDEQAEKAKVDAKALRIERLKNLCASASGLTKDLCDEVLDGR